MANQRIELRIALNGFTNGLSLSSDEKTMFKAIGSVMKDRDLNSELNGWKYLGVIEKWEVERDELTGREELVILATLLD